MFDLRFEPSDLEQFSELRVRRNSAATRSILRPARPNSLASLGQKRFALSVKCSKHVQPPTRSFGRCSTTSS
ncbi:hypothetical protein DVJ83_17170 (plasmid) [Deinococcus wulumuqiensis]|uniref:Uncharacterized protein n=1 Tax=Deinococcus wulumuqiensis TaxID=980427 RepID=A0A345IN94_9DEIO|nr:hypothetical protein DVJ83_17170 [Deinococcus wulumuqiensis]